MGLYFIHKKFKEGGLYMKKDKFVLADSTIIEMEPFCGIGDLKFDVEDISAACALWEKFTNENLKQVIIKDAEGTEIGEYSNMILDHMTGNDNKDGTIQLTFNLRSRSVEEILTERVCALEAGQQTHGEAIGDLGQAVSDIAEGGAR